MKATPVVEKRCPKAEPLFADNGVKKQVRSLVESLTHWFMQHYFTIEVEGTRHIPKDASFFIAANHSSHLDNVALLEACGFPFEDYVFMAAKDYFFGKHSWKFFWIKYLLNIAPFDRKVGLAAMHENLFWCASCKQEQKKIIIYPEATRSVDGEMQAFKRGCAFLAHELNMPILPVYIEGSFACLPKGKWWPKRGTIKLRFAKPLTMSIYKNDDTQRYNKITQDLELAIKKLRSTS